MTTPDRLLQHAQALSDDLIVAVSTAPGRGAIGIVRISGSEPAVLSLLRAVLGERAAANLPARRMQRATLRDPRTAETIDQALVVRFPGPRSYTGQDVVEFHLHGSPVVLELAVGALQEAGARPAGPGEFTRRAVASGRITLVQAEAIDALVRAESEAAVAAAHRHLGGELGLRVTAWRDGLLGVAAALEAEVDFPEEVADGEGGWDGQALRVLRREMTALLGSFDAGRRLVDGVRVVLRGPTNAGKSTLFNGLLGHARAIVSEHPGTTRDVVAETVQWSGRSFRLEDTAGLRGAKDPIEAEGIERSAAATLRADLVLEVRDGRIEVGRDTGQGAGGSQLQLFVATHGDLLAPDERQALLEAGWLVVAAPTGQGLGPLREAVVDAARGDAGADSLLLHTARQRDALSLALRAVDEALESGEDEPVLAAVSIGRAGRALEELGGAWTEDGVLDALFERFCIGK